MKSEKLTSMDKKLFERCEKAHYDILKGMYYSGETDLGEAKIVWNDEISDLMWNYGTRIKTQGHAKDLIERVSDFLNHKKRQPAFYITPFCEPANLDVILESLGFEHVFTDAWMFFDGKPYVKIPPGIQLKLVETEADMLLFKKVYDTAYSSGSGPYSFPPEYGVAVLNSFHRQIEGVTADNYLAFDGKTPLGILSLLSQGDLFGIYNVGTHPSFQGKGIGSILTLLATRDALEKGAQAIFLQTEKESSNEQFYRNRGFITCFIGKCYAK